MKIELDQEQAVLLQEYVRITGAPITQCVSQAIDDWLLTSAAGKVERMRDQLAYDSKHRLAAVAS